MPFPALFTVMFFIVLLALGIDSAFSLVESFTAAFREYLEVGPERIAKIASVTCFCAGIPFVSCAGLYWLDIADHFVTNYALVSVAILQTLIIGWSKNGRLIPEHLRAASPWFPIRSWWWIVRVLIPLILITMMLMFFYEEVREPYENYPGRAIAVDWCFVAIPLFVGIWLNGKCAEREK